jgi:hypothetical protein
MLKLLLLLIFTGVVAGAGYWYGYDIGQKDASRASHSHSLSSQTEQYLDRLRSIEVQYRDKDGNIVIPKVKWDELNRDAHGGAAH